MALESVRGAPADLRNIGRNSSNSSSKNKSITHHSFNQFSSELSGKNRGAQLSQKRQTNLLTDKSASVGHFRFQNPSHDH